MRLIGISDLHGNLAVLQRILQQGILPQNRSRELILVGGDITSFGSPDYAEELVNAARALGFNVRAVAGNCDSAQIDRRLLELGVSLHGRGIVLDGVGIHGLSAMPPWREKMHHFTEEELSGFLLDGYRQIGQPAHHVVLSHAPPRAEMVDLTRGSQHVGSTALRRFIDRTQPDLVVCGHIHEARGVEMLGRTTVVNCGFAAAGEYAVIELGERVTVELHSL